MKAITPRQQDRRNRILECTRQQVARLGYDGVSMRELAIEADVSTATLYNLFNSKDELILAASQELLADIVDQSGQGERGLSRFIKRLEVTAQTIVSNPKYADAMGRMLFVAEASAPVVKLLMDQSRRQNEISLREMQEDGDLIENVDLERLARDLAGISWSVNLMWMKGFIALHDFQHEYKGTVINALLPWLNDEQAAVYRKETGILR